MTVPVSTFSPSQDFVSGYNCFYQLRSFNHPFRANSITIVALGVMMATFSFLKRERMEKVSKTYCSKFIHYQNLYQEHKTSCRRNTVS